jgi:hypothetical protein
MKEESVIAGLTRNLLITVNSYFSGICKKLLTVRMGLRVKPAMTG